MDRDREIGRRAADEQDEDAARATEGGASFVGAHAAARGLSPGLLQRKIQRRAERRPGAEAAPEAPEAREGGGAAADDREDANVVELKSKVARLVDERFGGDYRKAFAHYDRGGDGGVGRDELMQLLKDAGVGNGLTRGAWASGIIEKMDGDGDGRIQWPEFQAGVRG